jgi:ribose/xylose/arabinose/galactoside ABC-type transport system permease subunit
LLVVVLKVDALIVTLGTLSIFGGYTFLRTSGSPVVADNEVFAHVGRGAAFGVPIVVVTLFAVALILGGVLRYTTFGQRCYAVGDNGRAAQLAGVRVAVIRVSALAISGATASIAGLLVVANSGVASPGTGDRYLLSAIAAVVIGGTPLAGGIGTISGTLVGIAVLGTIDNGLNLLEVSSFWQDSLRGTIVLFALIADGLRRRPK